MTTEHGRFVVVFNGEIYNYPALRTELEAGGTRFRTTSDTEVLLHLYARHGADMVHRLRGMYAFAIWDDTRRGLLLARDPYGIKPLYYADDGMTLRFASQVRALLAGGNITSTPDPAGWVGFYLFGSVPDPFTIYRDIRAVPAGSTLWVNEKGTTEPSTFASLAAVFCHAEREECVLDSETMLAKGRDALLDSVRHHLVADVPVGAFLSAGVDSGALVGLMRDAGQRDIQTVTLAFDEFKGRHDDEAPLAAEVAAHYSTQHTTRVIPEQEFREDLPRILQAMDQPSVDGINTWFVSKAARELDLKVAISGLGGDELFGGYSSFRTIPRWVRLTAIPSRLPFADSFFQGLVSALARYIPKLNPKAAGLLTYGANFPGAFFLQRGLFMPWELGTLLDADFAEEGLRRLAPLQHIAAALTPAPRSEYGVVATLESVHYMGSQLLRDTDWASMEHSLEVRVPLVDYTLLSAMAPHLVGRSPIDGKALLGRSPSRPLPEKLIHRPKTGFSTPIQSWIARGLPRLRRASSTARSSDKRGPWARQWAREVALGPI